MQKLSGETHPFAPTELKLNVTPPPEKNPSYGLVFNLLTSKLLCQLLLTWLASGQCLKLVKGWHRTDDRTDGV